jgi:hypothetical protein
MSDIYNQYKLKHIQQKPRTNTDPIKKNNSKKWAIFTYTGRETKNVTEVLKYANINIAYNTKNTIEHILRPELSTATEHIYNNSSIYQLKCFDCPKKYIGQTGRTFKTRYKEHLQAIHNSRT